jgi:uncharacterized protein with von Willebrand factor type A (vWA) domain
VKGKDELSRLTRASYFVSREDLVNAVKELEQLDPDGLPAKLCSDWLKDAKGRLVTDMAIQVRCLFVLGVCSEPLAAAQEPRR